MQSFDEHSDFDDDTVDRNRFEFEIQDVIEIIQRRWRWLALGVVLGLAIGTSVWWTLPRKYVATTSILVEPQEVPESYVRSTITLDVAQRLRTLQQRVTSVDNLNVLIARVGRWRLDPSGRLDEEELRREIYENLEVSVETPHTSGSQTVVASIVEISFVGRYPEALAETVRQITKLFIDENRKDRAQQAASTAMFLETELNKIREEVTAQEHRMGEFRSQHMGALPSGLEGNYRELERLTESLRSNLEAQERLSERLRLAALAAEESELGGLMEPLAATRELLRQSQRLYTEEHPKIVSLRAQIELDEVELAEARASWEARDRISGAVPTPATSLMKLSFASSRRAEQDLRTRIADVEHRIAETPSNNQRLLELSRDYETLMATYKLLLGKKHDAALARNLEDAQMAEQFTLLRPARTPTKPFFPDPLIVIPGGLAGVLGLVALLIAWVEIRKPAFHSIETLARRLGLPVLAAIPELIQERIYEEVPLPEKLDWRLVVECAPKSAAAEQYRGFTPYFLARQNCRIILVTSAQPGDGKSITCANLACTLASDLGRRVLLIDCDLRRSSQHKIAGVSREPGVADVLQGDAELRECIRPVTANLSLLPAGSAPENPLALLTSEGFLKLCTQAAENYDVVMLDSPPIMPVIDAKILHTLSDMVVFVVRAGVSPSGSVIRSIRELSNVGGIVFNQVSQGAFQHYYQYGAYAYDNYAEIETTPDRVKSQDPANPREKLSVSHRVFRGGRRSRSRRNRNRW